MLYNISIYKRHLLLVFKLIFIHFVINSKLSPDNSLHSNLDSRQKNELINTEFNQSSMPALNSVESTLQEKDTTNNKVDINLPGQQKQINTEINEQAEDKCPICLIEYNDLVHSKFPFCIGMNNIVHHICIECLSNYISNPINWKSSEKDIDIYIIRCPTCRAEKTVKSMTDILNRYNIKNISLPNDEAIINAYDEELNLEEQEFLANIRYNYENIVRDLINFFTNNTINLSDELSIMRINCPHDFLYGYTGLSTDIEIIEQNRFRRFDQTNIDLFFQILDACVVYNRINIINENYLKIEIAATDFFQEHIKRVLDIFPFLWVVLNIKDTYQELDFSNTRISSNIQIANNEIKILQIKVHAQRILDILKIFSNVKFEKLRYLTIENNDLNNINDRILYLNIKQDILLWNIRRIEIIDFDIYSLYTLLKILSKCYSNFNSIRLTIVYKNSSHLQNNNFNPDIHPRINLTHPRIINDQRNKCNLFFVFRTGTSFNKSNNILFSLIESLKKESYTIYIDEKTSWNSNYDLSIIKSDCIVIINETTDSTNNGDGKILIHRLQLNKLFVMSCRNAGNNTQNQMLSKFDIKKSNLKILCLFKFNICLDVLENICNLLNLFDKIERLAIISPMTSLNMDLETKMNQEKGNLKSIENVSTVMLDFYWVVNQLSLSVQPILKFIDNIKSMKVLFLSIGLILRRDNRSSEYGIWNFDSIKHKNLEIIVFHQEENITNSKEFNRKLYNTIKQLKENNKKLKHIIFTRSNDDKNYIIQVDSDYMLDEDDLADPAYYEKLKNSKNITGYENILQLKNEDGKQIFKIVDSIVVIKEDDTAGNFCILS